MLRFKQFSGNGLDLENAVNAWLSEFDPDVTQMTQSQIGETILMSFLFEESFRGQELRLSHEHGLASISPQNSDNAPDERIPVRSPGLPA